MKRPLIFLSAVLLGASLQGCGGGDEKQAAAPALPADSCTGHELEVALPPAGKPLFGYDFLSRRCGYNDATVVFGAADGSKRLEIVLTDTGLPAPPTEGDAVAYRAAQDKLREMTQTNLTLLHKTRETALKNGTAERFGGEDYLPLIDTTRMGDPLGVMVPAKGEEGVSTLSGVIKNRYVLTLSTRDTPNGGSATAMRQVLVPFVEQMKLTKLP